MSGEDIVTYHEGACKHTFYTDIATCDVLHFRGEGSGHLELAGAAEVVHY